MELKAQFVEEKLHEATKMNEVRLHALE